MLLQDLLQNPEYKQKFVLEKFIQEVLQITREEMWMQMDKEVSQLEVDQILTYYRAYVEDKKPMEYILGHVDFFQVPFIVNENTLIPRPETEYMITAVTEYLGRMLLIVIDESLQRLQPFFPKTDPEFGFFNDDRCFVFFCLIRNIGFACIQVREFVAPMLNDKE